MDGFSVEILLIDDNPADSTLIKRILKQADVVNNLHLIEDGVEAMKFLRQQVPYENAPRPDLILMDINLPKKDGREVLAEIKMDEDLMVIPVVILSGSNARPDIMKSYQLHANAYMTKPANLIQFVKVVQTIGLLL